jgi:hypothetical protein
MGGYAEHCVYTIRHSDRIAPFSRSEGPHTINTKRKRWISTKRLIADARKQGKTVLVLFAPAEDTKVVVARADLVSVRVGTINSFNFTNLRYLRQPLNKTALIKRSGTKLRRAFIREYAICRTPALASISSRSQSGTSAEAAVEHLVGYHNSDNNGPINKGRRVPQGRTFRWDTAHWLLNETIVGNRLWAIEGGGRPKRYRLMWSGIIKRRTPVERSAKAKYQVHYSVDTNFQPIDVTDFPWFRRLRKEQRSFSYGLRKTRDHRVITALEALRFRKDPPRRVQRGLVDEEFHEGEAIQVVLTRYERNPAARERCIRRYGTTCMACGLSFAQRYGPETNKLIHVHHLKPLASVGARSSHPVRDLRPVCPNCHAVIHLTKPPRTIEQIKRMLRKQARDRPNRGTMR